MRLKKFKNDLYKLKKNKVNILKRNDRSAINKRSKTK